MYWPEIFVGTWQHWAWTTHRDRHTTHQLMGGGGEGGEDGGMGGGWGWGVGRPFHPHKTHHMEARCPKISTWTHNSWDFIKIIILSLDSERAGSRTLENFSRRDRDWDCAKFERSRRFRDSNMNPKKKSHRYRVSVSIHALDLAIYRFTHSLDGNTHKSLYASFRARICKPFKEPRKRFPAWRALQAEKSGGIDYLQSIPVLPKRLHIRAQERTVYHTSYSVFISRRPLVRRVFHADLARRGGEGGGG